jgi:hypothetical protein
MATDVVISFYFTEALPLFWELYLISALSPRSGQRTANLLTPLPSLFCFLNMTAFRDDPELAPFAIGGNLLADAIGYIGGGVEPVVIYSPKQISWE